MYLNGRVILCFSFSIFFLLVTVLAIGYSQEARLLPLLTGGGGLLLSVMQFVSEVRASPAHDRSTYDKQGRDRAILMFTWLLGLVLGTVLFGILVAASIAVSIYFLFIEKFSKSKSLLLTISFVTVLYITFELMFNLTLFRGLVVNMH